MFKKSLAIAALAAVAFTAEANAQSREQISIVGSSTLFPFSSAVAERFGRFTDFQTPKVESTGSGGGMKLFCAGIGVQHPDITNASRRIKASELEKCTENGVTITEVKVGFDGIVLANSKKAESYALSKKQIFMALAKEVPVDGKLVENPYTTWNEIDPSLPDSEIEVLGPPPTSGTRDAFVELVMREGAEEFPMLAKLLEDEGKGPFRAVADAMREDGRFIEAGENDNLIVQKLEANPAALGIFGFSFLDQNRDKIHGSVVGGVEPTFENIADGKYGVSRSLYFYIKHEHVGVIPGIEDFVAEFTSERAWGPDGYLIDKGLIPLSDAEREKMREQAMNLEPLSM